MTKNGRVALGDVTVAKEADEIARKFTSFWMPSLVTCPSDDAEEATIAALSAAASEVGIPVEVVDLGQAATERLSTVTARLAGYRGRPETRSPGFVPTLLILRAFDVFGDEAHEGPIYPFRSDFQFDEEYRWVFLGRNSERMRFLFFSYQRPLYQAAMDLTPRSWR